MKIDEKEFLEKKLSVAKEILPVLLSKVDADAFIADPLKRGSLVYKSSALAEHLLKEVGYEVKKEASQRPDATQEKTGMIKLDDLKKK